MGKESQQYSGSHDGYWSEREELDALRSRIGNEMTVAERKRYRELAGIKGEESMSFSGVLCPRCRANMVLRKNKDTGDPFFGCSTFPTCRGTMPLEEGVRAAIMAGRLNAESSDIAPGDQPLKQIAKDLALLRDEQRRLADRQDIGEDRVIELRDTLQALQEDIDALRVPLDAVAHELALSRKSKSKRKEENMEEKKVSAEDARKSAVPAMDQLKSFGEAIGTGVAMGGVDKVGDLFVTMAMKMSKNSPAITAALADPLGREIVKFLTATTVRTTCLSAPNLVPGSDGIARAADLQITYSSAKLTSEGLSLVGDELAALAKIGKELAALPAPSQVVGGGVYSNAPAEAAGIRR